jgi:hypothetical protein
MICGLVWDRIPQLRFWRLFDDFGALSQPVPICPCFPDAKSHEYLPQTIFKQKRSALLDRMLLRTGGKFTFSTQPVSASTGILLHLPIFMTRSRQHRKPAEKLEFYF